MAPRTCQSDRPWGVRGKSKFSFPRLPVEFTRELQAVARRLGALPRPKGVGHPQFMKSSFFRYLRRRSR